MTASDLDLSVFDDIATDRLHLVPVAEAHLDDLMRVNGDDRVTAFLPYASWRDRGDAEAWFGRMTDRVEQGLARQLVLLREADGRAIGTLLVFNPDAESRRAEIGYALAADCWQQGLVREALTAACAVAFGACGLRRLEAEADVGNTASCTLLKNVGFQREGVLRQRWTRKGRTYDTALHGLLAADWTVRWPVATTSTGRAGTGSKRDG